MHMLKLPFLLFSLRTKLTAAEAALNASEAVCGVLSCTPEEYARVRLYRQAVRRAERLVSW